MAGLGASDLKMVMGYAANDQEATVGGSCSGCASRGRRGHGVLNAPKRVVHAGSGEVTTACAAASARCSLMRSCYGSGSPSGGHHLGHVRAGPDDVRQALPLSMRTPWEVNLVRGGDLENRPFPSP